jgi:hypothetical protein
MSQPYGPILITIPYTHYDASGPNPIKKIGTSLTDVEAQNSDWAGAFLYAAGSI